MKSIVVFLVLGLAAYGLWEYIENNPAVPAVRVPAHAREPEASPTPEPTPEDTGPKKPNLEKIPVKGGAALTHATMKAVRSSGVVFLCDQGLVEVPFNKLPADMVAYYAPMVPPEPSPGIVAAPPLQPTAQPKPRQEKSFVQDAQDRLSFTETRMALRDRIKMDQDTIDHWYKQSEFVKDGYVTESQFNAAKADLDATVARLAELEASGPGN